MSEPSFSAIPDTRAVGQGNPPADMNEETDESGLTIALLAQMLTGASTLPVQNVANHNANIAAISGLLGNINATRTVQAGATFNPMAYGAKGDGVTLDDAAIAAAIAAVPGAGGLVDLSGAPVSYLVSRPIALTPGLSVTGTFINNQDTNVGTNKVDVLCSNTFAGQAVIGDSGVLNQGPTQTCTVSNSSGTALFTTTGSNAYTNNMPVIFTPSTTTMPGGFTKGSLYYVVGVSGLTWQLALAPGGAALPFSSAGSGVSMGQSAPTSSLSNSIRGVSIDCTNVPNTAGTPDVIKLMTARSNVEYNLIRGGAFTGTSIHFTDTNGGGFNLGSNSANENACRFNWLIRCGGSGIVVDRNVNALTDGFCLFNLVQQQCTNLGDGWNSTGNGAIDIEDGADWQIVGNHCYRVPGNGIVVGHTFTSFVAHNKVDNFGLAGAATNYRGIWLNGVNGVQSSCFGNEVDTREDFGQAGTTYNYIEFDGQSASTGSVAAWGNSVRKTNNNPNTGNSNALSASTSGNGVFSVTDFGFYSTATGAPGGTSTYAYTATSASPCVFTAAGTAFAAGQPITVSTGAPTGFTNGTTYFVVAPSGTTFQLALVPGGAAVNSTSTGSGNVIQVTTPPALAANLTNGATMLRGPFQTAFTNPPTVAGALAIGSATPLMAGMGAFFTPALTGKVRMRVAGALGNLTANTTASAVGRYSAATLFSYTATSASPAVFTATNSALAANTPVVLFSGGGTGGQLAGVPPTGFTNGTVYYVVSPVGATFSLATTQGGAAINSTGTGSGTQWLAVAPNNQAALTGTAFGQGTVNVSSAASGAGVYNRPFVCEHVATGLTLGTPYWLDLALATGVAADAATVSNLAVAVEEIN